jgi:hypothetical protein
MHLLGGAPLDDGSDRPMGDAGPNPEPPPAHEPPPNLGPPPAPAPFGGVPRFDATAPQPPLPPPIAPLPPPIAPQPPPPPPATPAYGGPGALGPFGGTGPGTAPAPAPVSEAVLAIPLGIRELVRQSLDLLTRRDAGLRGASFYIGFMLLVTFGPMAVILGLMFTVPGIMDIPSPDAAAPGIAPAPDVDPGAWPAWILLAMLPAALGYLAAGVEARSMATAVIGGRVEGRPLRLRESISVARRRFWSVLGAQVLIGIVSFSVSMIVQVVLTLALQGGDELVFGVSLVVAVIIGAPFVYVPAGIILGEVDIVEAIRRSLRLVRMRKMLAVVVTLFSVLSQFIVLFGLSQGIDIIGRLLIGAGVVEQFPPPLVVPVAAALVFAAGTLTFLVEAIAAAPAVHAFAALTHYTHGLQAGRDNPVGGRSLWSPWVTPGLALCALTGLLALVGAVLTLPA